MAPLCSFMMLLVAICVLLVAICVLLVAVCIPPVAICLLLIAIYAHVALLGLIAIIDVSIDTMNIFAFGGFAP